MPALSLSLPIPFPFRRRSVRRLRRPESLALLALLMLACLLVAYVCLFAHASGVSDALRINSGCTPVCRQIVAQSLKGCVPCVRAALLP